MYQWEQELFDGSTQTFEKIKRLDTVVVIAVTPEQKILIVEQEQPLRPKIVSLPGGRMDEGEDPLGAIKRELLEETGYTSDNWEMFDAFQPVSKIDWAIYYFIARDAVNVGEQKLDAGEKIGRRLVDFDEFLEIASSDAFGDAELKMKVLQARLGSVKMQELRKKILGN